MMAEGVKGRRSAVAAAAVGNVVIATGATLPRELAIPGRDLAGDVAGNVADAIDVRDGGPAELHHQTGHVASASIRFQGPPRRRGTMREERPASARAAYRTRGGRVQGAPHPVNGAGPRAPEPA